MDERPEAMWDGAVLGLPAGLAALLVAMVAAVLFGLTPTEPVRMIAAVPLGREVLTGHENVAVVITAGLIFHAAVSSLWGALYGIICGALPASARTSGRLQISLSLLFGLVVWLVDVRMIAPYFFPWFLGVPVTVSLLVHMVGFGLPLGWLFARRERRLWPAESATA